MPGFKVSLDVLDEQPEESPPNALHVCPRDATFTLQNRQEINSYTPLIPEEDEEEYEEPEDLIVQDTGPSFAGFVEAETENNPNSSSSNSSNSGSSTSTSTNSEDGLFSLRTLKKKLSERSQLQYQAYSSNSSSSAYVEAEEDLDSFVSLPQFELDQSSRNPLNRDKSTRSRRESVFSILSKGTRAGLESLSRNLRSRHTRTTSQKETKTKGGYYITDNFCRRDCNHFIPRPQKFSSAPSERCKCGLPAENHVISGTFNSADVSNSASPWSYLRHTIKQPTNAFGYIDFVDNFHDHNTMPHYLRLEMETPICKITELLTEKWDIHKPRLIMSVFGESRKDIDENFLKRNSELFTKLTAGLINAAKTTQAWFFTAGYDCGVNKLIGQAVGNSRSFINAIPAIGIGHWGAVASRSKLVGEGGLFPAKYCHRDKDLHQLIREERPLEPNHTHFLLIDRGHSGMFMSAEMLKKRVAIEAGLSQSTKAQFISIMIGGDLKSLEELKCRVEEGCAVVIMKGTGRMADILCQFHDSFQAEFNRNTSWHGMKLSCTTMEKTLSLLRSEFPRRKNQNFEEQLAHIKNLSRYWKDRITICDCNVNSVDRIILKGLIQNIKSESITVDGPMHNVLAEQLKLAIIWNRVDLVEDSLKIHSIPPDLAHDLLFLALKLDRVAFIRNLLDNCADTFDISQCLTEDRFLMLLNDVSQSSFLRKLLRERKKSMKRYGKVFSRPRVGESKYKFRFEHFANVIYKISSGVYQCCKNKRSKLDSNSYDFDDPDVVLVLFCVLEQRQEMAMFFWEQCSAPTMLALVACHIYKWMAEKESSYIEITPEMKPIILQYASEFETLAWKIVDEVSHDYPVKWVTSLITHNYYNWGGKNLLQIADYTECHLFISHDSIQDYLTGEWMGMLEPDMTYWNIVFTIPFPFLASFRKISDSEIQNKMISKETDEMERKKMAFISEKAVEGTERVETTEPGKRRLNLLQRMYHFYNAPVVKFFIYILMYFAFLACFAYALLVKQETKGRASNKMDNAELVVYVWTVSVIPVEIRQIYHSCPSTVMGKLKNYLSNQYNRFDVYSMIFIFISFCCRYFPRLGVPEDAQNQPPPRLEEAVFRVFFALGFAGMCLRLLQAMQINSKLGPKVLMVASMIMDLVFFLGLLGMALICYGVPTKSLMTPLKSEVTTDMVYSLFWRPYINMFGELDLDSLTEDINEGYCLLAKQYDRTVNCTGARTEYDCNADGYCFYNRLLIMLMMAAYLMVVAVMMLNLLVAVFTFTYDQINANSSVLWRWQRYELVTEFKMRSSLPIPLNTIVLSVFFLGFLYRKTCRAGELIKRRDAYKRRHDHKQDRISLLESECRRKLLNKMHQLTETKQIQREIHTCSTSVVNLTTAVYEFNQNLQGIVDQTINARSIGPVVDVPLPDPNDWGHHPSLSRSLQTVSTPTLPSSESMSRVYPDSGVVRDFVPPFYKSWSVVYLSYNPPSYSQSPELWGSPAEVEYNKGDRRSSLGVYGVRDNLPLNPRGRTGLAGRGNLPHWGPNHMAVPILSRGLLVEREYLDSTFNTDNAWLELICYNFHDHDHELPDMTDSSSAYRWTNVSRINFTKSKHSDLLTKVKFMRS
ncbi:hypothetical protein ACHWQZ_G005374 [Mnemiopsis leidyi]